MFKIANLSLRSRFLRPKPRAELIVSLTSFPARIEHAWIAIESIFQQDLCPSKVVLVLSDEEFPKRELPKKIQQQMERGLEVLWCSSNIRSFKKLIPTRKKYPEATIVTFDDDIIYEPWRLSQLVEAAKKKRGTIIGHRGWVVKRNINGFEPYNTWSQANSETPYDSCFLTSGAGVLFPPHILPLETLLKTELALQLCPLADDIWFWAVARKAGVGCYCLGNHHIETVYRLKRSPSLFSINLHEGQNDLQLRAVCNYFSLI